MPVAGNVSAFPSPCDVASKLLLASDAQFAPPLLLREERLCFSESYRHQTAYFRLISTISTLQLSVTNAICLQQRCARIAPREAVFMPKGLYAIASGAALRAIASLGV